jgi:hypothetical protein
LLNTGKKKSKAKSQLAQINPNQTYLGEFDNSYVLSEEEPVQFTKSYKIGHTLGRLLGRLAGYITINKT